MQLVHAALFSTAFCDIADSAGVPLLRAVSVLNAAAGVVGVGHILHVHSYHLLDRRATGE
jgi:hypothetical protein